MTQTDKICAELRHETFLARGEGDLLVRRTRLYVKAIQKYGIGIEPELSPVTGLDYNLTPTNRMFFWFRDKYGPMAISDYQEAA
jgi:hypothetical protein